MSFFTFVSPDDGMNEEPILHRKRLRKPPVRQPQLQPRDTALQVAEQMEQHFFGGGAEMPSGYVPPSP